MPLGGSAAREDLQPCVEPSRNEGALARAVAADDADDLAALDLEGDILERPEVFGLRIVDCGLLASRVAGLVRRKESAIRNRKSEIASRRVSCRC